MQKSFVAVALLPLVTACGANFSQKEAEAVASATSDLTSDAYGALYSDMASRHTEAQLDWVETETGFSFSGTLTSDGDTDPWSGTMDFDGELQTAEESAQWAFSVAYNDVAYADTTYNGDMDWTWDLSYTDSAYTMENSVQGEITAVGENTGSGEIDYTSTITFDAQGFTYTVVGTIGGHEVDVEYGWTDLLGSF